MVGGERGEREQAAGKKNACMGRGKGGLLAQGFGIHSRNGLLKNSAEPTLRREGAGGKAARKGRSPTGLLIRRIGRTRVLNFLHQQFFLFRIDGLVVQQIFDRGGGVAAGPRLNNLLLVG